MKLNKLNLVELEECGSLTLASLKRESYMAMHLFIGFSWPHNFLVKNWILFLHNTKISYIYITKPKKQFS